MAERLRAAFLGQKWLGERCFELLRAAEGPRIEIALVVSNSQPDRWWRTNNIFPAAREAGVAVLSNEKRDAAALETRLRSERVDVILSVQHPWILPGTTLELVGGRAFNVHSAKLPEYGGHNAVNHALLNGERRFTSTVHWMTTEVDAGAVAFEETFEIEPDDHARGLYERGIDAGQTVFERLLSALVTGAEVPRRPLAGGVRFYRRDSLDGLRDVTELEDSSVRALRARALFFPPFEPAYLWEAARKTYLLPAGFAPYVHEFSGEETARWAA